MEGLRVVLRDDAPIEASSRILLSIDELYRILAWAQDEYELEASRVEHATWRVVPGLALRRALPGSSMLDLFASLPPPAQTAVVTGAVSVVGILAKWITRLIDPKHRAEVTSITAETKKTLAEARGQEIANDFAEEMNALTLRKERLALAESVNASSAPVAVEDVSLDDRALAVIRSRSLHERIDTIFDSGDLEDELYEQIYEPARRKLVPPSKALRATEDASASIRRIVRHQSRSSAVERVEVIDS